MKCLNENRRIFQHFVLTCFNVLEISHGKGKGLGQFSWPDKTWLKHRFKLFDKFCYPSLRGQSNKNFKWLVLFNINTPDVFKEKIEKYTEWENFIPVYIKPCKNAMDPDKITREEIIPQYLTDEIEYLITTRIDSDDAICKDYIEMIQKRFDKQKLQFLDFTNGYVWNYHYNEIYLNRQPSNPFISLIEEVGEIKTVWCGSHPELYKVGPVREITTKPAWLQVVHGKSTNRTRGILQPPKKIVQSGSDFEIRKNLFLSSWIGAGCYFVGQILERTRQIRGYMGLTGSQLNKLREKLRGGRQGIEKNISKEGK